VYNEIAVISAKFSVNLINSYTVTSCKTMDRCLAFVRCTYNNASEHLASLTSFFDDVILHVVQALSFAYFWWVLGGI